MSSAISSTTQDHLDIEDIIQDIIILKDGSACLILQVSAVNFGLYSETEQEATIYAYAQMLNSLTFSIQIVVNSKRKDISDYVKRIDEFLVKTQNSKLRDQITKYREFVLAIVRQGNVLDKKFYISIPFSSTELGLGSSFSALSRKKPKLSIPKTTIVDRSLVNLAPKRDHLIRMLARIGLHAHQLNSQELLQLFYEFYNPEHLGTQVQLSEQPPAETPAPENTPK